MSRLNADQVEAFEAMALAGRTVDELAAKFGISPAAVRARMAKLTAQAAPARMAPTLGPVKLTQARAFQCRFCIEDIWAPSHADLLVCGKRTIEGKSWCPEHACVVWPRTGSKLIDSLDNGHRTAWGADLPDLQP